MPELPDVEIFRRRIEEDALRRVVETVSVRSGDLLMDTSGSSLGDALRGHTLRETLRHGKHLFVRSGEERRRWLRLHFGMTGSLEVYRRDEEDEPDHTHLRLDLEGGSTLAYRCPRKFGEIGLVDDPTPTDQLDADAVARLWKSTKSVLEIAVERGADPERLPDDWLVPRREEGPCPRCYGSIVKSEVGGRPTYYCDSHQSRG